MNLGVLFRHTCYIYLVLVRDSIQQQRVKTLHYFYRNTDDGSSCFYIDLYAILKIFSDRFIIWYKHFHFYTSS